MRGFFLLIGLMICASPIQAIEPSSRNASGLGEAYGFVFGQNLTLQRIADDYPDLAREALLAKLKFQRAFGDIHVNLEPKLVEFLGEDVFKVFRAKLENQLMDMAQGEEINRILAENFLEEVRNRAKGDIYSPTLEYLLAVRFSENPVSEYANGFRQTYQTDGTGKSRGVVLRIELPKSWQEKKANRPHIVRKWQSEAGTGMELVILHVREMGGAHISRSDVAGMLQPGEVDALVPEDGVLYDYGMVSIEDLPGYFVDFGLLAERAGVVMFQQMRQYAFFLQGQGRFCSVLCRGAGERA
ncbi:hypothetical protein [Marinobacter sediminicola]|uniref:hypothetical protein n=1 Tax=Marinobacter sediminicola TaxID=3072994 RepID=UPI00281116E9|nr:hypothetical protein [Marinobacter sp. F26243]